MRNAQPDRVATVSALDDFERQEDEMRTTLRVRNVRVFNVVSAGLLFAGALGILHAQTHDASHYRVLGFDNKHIAIVNGKGEVEWEFPNEATAMHDIQLLPNGNILFHNGPNLREVTPAKQIVWEYQVKPKEGVTARVSLHSFQRLDNGLTMVAESGNKRIVEVDKDGKIVHEIPITGSDTRMVRPVPGGGYLVAHEADGKVREYDREGKVVWEYALDMNNLPAAPGLTGHGVAVFGVKRLPNGNTLIAGGNNNRVIEVTKAGQIVWSVESKDLPGITLAWITSLDVLPNGNLIFGNSHAGPDNPQLIEVTRDKKVVWTFKNLDVFGNQLVATKVIPDRK
jgi:PQQ-like domain